MKSGSLNCWNLVTTSVTTMEQHTERSDNSVVSPSLLKWNSSEYVFNPDFDLGLGDEWTVRFPLSSDTAKSSRSNSSLPTSTLSLTPSMASTTSESGVVSTTRTTTR